MTTEKPSPRWTCSPRGLARSSAAVSARSGSTFSTRVWQSAASTRNTTPGTAIYAATVRCRTQASDWASSARLPTSPASPTCATRFRSRERPGMRGISEYFRRYVPDFATLKTGYFANLVWGAFERANMDRRRFVIGAAATLFAARPACAQDAFPSHAITIVNAFPPGGLNDIVTRPLATAMEPILKQPVVV